MLQLTTLGALDLRDADGRALRDLVAQPKRIALLVHLAVESARGPVTRDRLLALLWPESDESRARNALSQTLYHLRQALGADAIVGQGATLTVAPAALHCDAVALETALAAGDAGAALDHYAGPFCPGLIVAGATAFDEWVSTTRLSQRTRLFALARQAVGGAAAAGDVHGAASLAHRALALMPDDERDVRFHMEAIGRAGDVPGALKRYAEYARRLATELELAPDPETVALAEAMRAPRVATPAAVRAVPVGDAPSADAVAAPAPVAATVAPQTPGARRPAVRRFPSLRAAVLAAGVVVGLAWTIAATARAGFAGGPDALRASRTVAVFPFTVRGSAASAFLADGMSHLLATKLDGTDVIRAIDPRSAVLAAEGRTPEPARGATLAHDLGARFYVLGDVAERAGRLQLDGALFDAESPAAAIATASVTGDSAALFSLVDELAGRLLAHLLEGRDRELTQLAAMTTSSLPALKAYLRGERAMREGRDAAAAAAFREAVAEDPTFALAWYRIAILSSWVVIPGIPESLTPISRAEAHADRLTPLGRDLVHAFLLYRQGDFAVREAYRRIVLGSPDNLEAWYMLGESEFHLGPLAGHPATDARASFERVLALQPSNPHALVHLARLAARERKADEVAAYLARLMAADTSADRIAEVSVLAASVRGDAAGARAALAGVQTADATVSWAIAQMAWSFANDLDLAERAARDLIARAPVTTQRIAMDAILAAVPLGRGALEGPLPAPSDTGAQADWTLELLALVAAEPAFGMPRARVAAIRDAVRDRPGFRTAPRPGSMYTPGMHEAARTSLLALLALRLGDRDGFRAHRAALARQATGGGDGAVTASRLLAAADAERLRQEGRRAEALAAYERIPPLAWAQQSGTGDVRERFARAELLRALGRSREAADWYGSFPVMVEAPFVPLARLREAQLREGLGERERAARAYADAVQVWRAPAPWLARLVTDAREGLARTAR